MNIYQRFKRNIFDVIQPFADASAGRLASRIFDDVIMLLIVFSVVSVFLCTFRIPEWLLRILLHIEFWSLVVFTIEYALRIWTANLLVPELGPFRSRIRYILSPMALIDLISILPFLLPFMPYTFVGVRAFRLVRLLRIFITACWLLRVGQQASRAPPQVSGCGPLNGEGGNSWHAGPGPPPTLCGQ